MNKIILRAAALTTFAMLGMLTSRIAMAADYAVGTVNLGTGSVGTSLNLYSMTRKGVDLIQNYILQQTDTYGRLVAPLALSMSMNPHHDFVYLAYTGPGPTGALDQPMLVAFSSPCESTKL